MAWKGMNWIRRDKRLAIYLRDSLTCVYCGTTLADGVVLTLDHLIPRSKGGTNRCTNLVTSCTTCNFSRGNKSLRQFIISPTALAVIKRNTRRKLSKYLTEARAILKRGDDLWTSRRATR